MESNINDFDTKNGVTIKKWVFYVERLHIIFLDVARLDDAGELSELS